MNDRATHRSSCQRAAIVLSVVGLTCGCVPSVFAADPSPSDEANVARRIVPISVVTQQPSRDQNPRSATWCYIAEILARGGLYFEQLSPSQLATVGERGSAVLVLSGDLSLTAAQRECIERLVEEGSSLIGIGGTSGLDHIFGVASKRPLTEGWIKVTAAEHGITGGLRSSLHVFGGWATTASSATSLAVLETGKQGARGSAILENCFGKGRAILLSPDLVFSVVHIQQGLPVLQDGKAAPDDTAELNDGELKAEDGLVLDWQRDRTTIQPDSEPVFLEPITDELREIMLRSIFHVAKEQGLTLPVLWYWPRSLKAVGHISHDTDGNAPDKAVALLEVMNRCNVKSTWCTLYPGGYPRKFYDTLKQQGHEIALHYDARTGSEKTSWSKSNFVLQHRWLLEEAGLERIVSNKNHYTRWEGRLDFLRWCETVGILSDQTRGPSKKGCIGFPLGGSQPFFPLDDEIDSPRCLAVLEVNMLTQDLVVVCPAEYGKQLLDSVLRHHGVAHFLFHPAHILKPHVADSLRELVDYGRSKELEWWTSEQIYRWEMLRRGMRMQVQSDGSLQLVTPAPIHDAVMLFLNPSARPQALSVDGKPAATVPWNVYGFPFDGLPADIKKTMKVQIRS